MKLNILLPTLGQRENELYRLFNSLEHQTNMSFKLIVISQANHEMIENILSEFTFNYEHIRINKIGLSIARNIGMNYVEGEYLALADDDAWYPDNSIDSIITEMECINEEIACFKIYDPISNKYYKNYNKHTTRVNKRQLLRKSSIEICFNIKKIGKDNIKFDENFGLGTKYGSGEENLLLHDLVKKGNKIRFVDKTVVFHQIKNTFEIDDRFIETKAEILKRILGKFRAYIFLNLILIKYYKNINKIGKLNAFKMVLNFVIMK